MQHVFKKMKKYIKIIKEDIVCFFKEVYSRDNFAYLFAHILSLLCLTYLVFVFIAGNIAIIILMEWYSLMLIIPFLIVTIGLYIESIIKRAK